MHTRARQQRQTAGMREETNQPLSHMKPIFINYESNYIVKYMKEFLSLHFSRELSDQSNLHMSMKAFVGQLLLSLTPTTSFQFFYIAP